MHPGISPRRQTTALSLAATIVACALAPVAGAGAAESRSDAGPLSPRLSELAQPGVNSAPPARQAREIGLPAQGPGSLLRQGGRVLAEVRYREGALAGVDDMSDSGAAVIDASRRYQTLTIATAPRSLPRLAAAPRVESVTEVLRPITSSTCPAGVAVSEGDAHLHANEARQIFGVNGAGVGVGILSDSFDQDGGAPTDAADDALSGDLPGAGNTCTGQATPVDVLEDFDDATASDEGRAMAQIVHDLAPRAELSFASAFTGLTAFAGNVEELAAAGADVIVDDVLYFEEPFFQEGPVGTAIGKVTDAGVSYYSAAGNNNLIAGGKNIASWEAPAFRPTPCPDGLPSYALQCMDFDAGVGADPTLGLTVSAGTTLTLDLQWAQPWNGVTTDLDAYLLDSSDGVVEESENFNAVATKKPFEFLTWKNTSGSPQVVRLAISRCDLSCDASNGGDIETPRLKVVLLQNGGGVTASEYPESSGGDVVGPTIIGHNGAADAVSVGAVAFDVTDKPERYSSRGPATHYFGPVNGVAAAPPLGSPAVLAKPDLAATDGGVNTFFGSHVGGSWRFYGTSAAAPHAAAVAALMRDADPTLDPAGIRSALAASALPVGAFGPDAVGAGLVDAVGALEQVAEPIEPGEGEEECEGACPAVPPGDGSDSDGGAIGSGEGSSTSPATGTLRSPEAAPNTFFRRKPRRVVRTRGRRGRAGFRFGANERGVVFLCQFDRKRYRRCAVRFVRWFRPGRHVLRVRARDAAGNVDRTPAVFRFRVRRVRR